MTPNSSHTSVRPRYQSAPSWREHCQDIDFDYTEDSVIEGDARDPDLKPVGDESPSLSAYHRLVLSTLEANGGEASIVQLAFDVVHRSNSRGVHEQDSRSVRETYLRIHSTIVEDFTEQGLVDYCKCEGTVRLAR